MEDIRHFLESSTIHGLTYISTNRKITRLFWIFIVITGFSVAGFMINASFQSWADSPIKTTIETRPISEIKFPKVTVCPPKNTYTDLNYDLMAADNVTLTKKMRRELNIHALEVIDKHFYLNKTYLAYINKHFESSQKLRKDGIGIWKKLYRKYAVK